MGEGGEQVGSTHGPFYSQKGEGPKAKVYAKPASVGGELVHNSAECKRLATKKGYAKVKKEGERSHAQSLARPHAQWHQYTTHQMPEWVAAPFGVDVASREEDNDA